MKSIIATVLMLFLVVNVGVLYYIVLFGDVPKFARRVDLLERRVDSLIRRDGDRLVVPEVKVTNEGSLVVLTDQQEEEIAAKSSQQVLGLVDEVVADKVEEKINFRLGQQAAKVYYLPFGSTRVKTADNNWVNTGLELEVNLGDFGDQRQVYFEGVLRVPSGNGQVEARLVDSLSGLVVGSELVGEGIQGGLRRTGELEIEPGMRTLRVEMRTSMDYEGEADALRLKIVVGESES